MATGKPLKVNTNRPSGDLDFGHSLALLSHNGGKVKALDKRLKTKRIIRRHDLTSDGKTTSEAATVDGTKVKTSDQDKKNS